MIDILCKECGKKISESEDGEPHNLADKYAYVCFKCMENYNIKQRKLKRKKEVVK